MKKLTFLIATCVVFFLMKCTSTINDPTKLNKDEIVLNFAEGETKWTSNKALKVMHELYINDQKNQTYKDGEAYRYVDLNYEGLKNLIWEMETAAQLLKDRGQEVKLGVRVFYTKYPDANDKESINHLKYDSIAYGVNDIILSPTFFDGIAQKTFDARANKRFLKDTTLKSFVSWDMKEPINKDKSSDPRKLLMYFYPTGHEIEDGTNLNHTIRRCPDDCPN